MVSRIYGQNGMAVVVERESDQGRVLQVGLLFARSGQPLQLKFAGEELQRFCQALRGETPCGVRCAG